MLDLYAHILIKSHNATQTKIHPQKSIQSHLEHNTVRQVEETLCAVSLRVGMVSIRELSVGRVTGRLPLWLFPARTSRSPVHTELLLLPQRLAPRHVEKTLACIAETFTDPARGEPFSWVMNLKEHHWKAPCALHT